MKRTLRSISRVVELSSYVPRDFRITPSDRALKPFFAPSTTRPFPRPEWREHVLRFSSLAAVDRMFCIGLRPVPGYWTDGRRSSVS
jgi:hypothetical protein